MKKKRVFKTRNNRKKMKYTFHSYGTYHSFSPYDFIEDDRVVDESGSFERVNMLEFYKREVKAANLPHVYILDNKGNELEIE